MYLAIDTSTDISGLALMQDSSVLAEMTWRCGQNHTTQLLPQLQHLLNLSKVEIKSVEGIIVATGPGTYNGLRVGVGTAKGLALSINCPIVGVSTLEATAYAYAASGLPICAIVLAGRTEVAAAIYQQKRGEWLPILHTNLTTIEELSGKLKTRTIFCGEISAGMAEELNQRLGGKALIPSPAACVRKPSVLAELGIKRLQSHDFDDAATLQPAYLRKPLITKAKHL